MTWSFERFPLLSALSLGAGITMSCSDAGTSVGPVGVGSASADSTDFVRRCSGPGVIKCVGFDNPEDFNYGRGRTASTVGEPHGLLPAEWPRREWRAVQDQGVKSSGAGSLRFTIPSRSGANTSGSYFTNFSNDLSVQFDEGQDFYLQWRQRFSRALIETRYAGGGGFKQLIVGSGDQSGKSYSSCSPLEIVVQNYEQRGFPVLYNSCTGSASHGPYDGFYEPFGNDFKFQNARPEPGCRYYQKPDKLLPPAGNCFGYAGDEWMTFQLHVSSGRRVGDEFVGSRVRFWVARARRPSELVVDWGPYNLTAGDPATRQRFGKVWLLPYNTGKSADQEHPEAYTWYDELIVSRQRIADPR